MSIHRRDLLATGTFGFLGVSLLGKAGSVVGADRERPSDKELIYRTDSPPNAEPALKNLGNTWITPIKHFYVRSHAPTPQLDAAAFRVSVEGLVDRPFQATAGELKSLHASVTATATLTCAGNRRNEHSKVKEVGGVQWDAGPIGNATWDGIRLSDVLKRAGVKEGAKHVWFESVDKIEKGGKVIPFGASIPLDKVFQDSDSMPGALIAFGMNGQPLPPDHGFPMRTVVPGFIGARSVKWLGRIVVSDRPSPNHYVATAYKVVKENTPAQWRNATPIYQFPVNSVICQPADRAQIAKGKLQVRGYALAEGNPDVTIAKVEVSADGGVSWTAAALHREQRPFCWRLWRAEVQVDSATKDVRVRAFDNRGRMQPETVAWNLKGYLFNAWHKVPITVP